MSSAFEDTVYEFDLNYLDQQNTGTSGSIKFEKHKKEKLSRLKSKIISTDCLIEKYQLQRQQLEETENNLVLAKEECKQICIDYTNVMETCSRLEVEIQLLAGSKKQLEERCFNSDNQYHAIQSHANQLQALVNQHNTVIESLKLESNLDKAAARSNEKKALSLEKENRDLLKHICLFRDIILDKRKLTSKHKATLQQYAKSSVDRASDDSSSEDDNSDIEEDIFEDVLSPPNSHDSHKNNASEVKKCVSSANDITTMELENDCNNEIVSVDTGRGSSLAFSDSEKCVHSPDYYIDESPLSRESIEHKVKMINIATSPLTVRSTAEVATSPITVLQEDVYCQIIIEEDSCSDLLKQSEPTQDPEHVNNNSVSPLNSDLNESILANPISVDKELAINTIEVGNVTVPHTNNAIHEQECLDINNSNNFLDETSNDGEVVMILNTMRMNDPLITPIPATPANISRGARPVLACSHNEQTEQPTNSACKEAVLARAEIKKLHSHFSDLEEEMGNMKINFNNQLLSLIKMCGHKEVDPAIISGMFKNNDSVEVCSNPENSHTPEKDDNRDYVYSPILEDPIIIPCQNLQSFQPEADPSHVQCTTNSPIRAIKSVTEVPDCHVESIPPNIILQRIEFEESLPPPISNNHVAQKRDKPVIVESIEIEMTTPESQALEEDIPATKDKRDKVKNNKLTKLGKLKKKLAPKFKIKSDKNHPVRKLRMKPKQFISKQKRITGSDSSATLNNRDVYANAVKVMAELKAKASKKDPKCLGDLKVNAKKSNTATSKDINTRIKDKLHSPKKPVTASPKDMNSRVLDNLHSPKKPVTASLMDMNTRILDNLNSAKKPVTASPKDMNTSILDNLHSPKKPVTASPKDMNNSTLDNLHSPKKTVCTTPKNTNTRILDNLHSPKKPISTSPKDMNTRILENSYNPTSPVRTRSRRKSEKELEVSSNNNKVIKLGLSPKPKSLNEKTQDTDDDDDMPLIAHISPRKRTRLFSSEKSEVPCKRTRLFSSEKSEVPCKRTRLFSSEKSEAPCNQTRLLSSEKSEALCRRTRLFSSEKTEVPCRQTRLFSCEKPEAPCNQTTLFSSKKPEAPCNQTRRLSSETSEVPCRQTRLFSPEKLDEPCKRTLRSSTRRKSTIDDNTNKILTVVISGNDMELAKPKQTKYINKKTATTSASDVPENQRPLTNQHSNSELDIELAKPKSAKCINKETTRTSVSDVPENQRPLTHYNLNAVSYSELDMFSDGPTDKSLSNFTEKRTRKLSVQVKESILGVMVEKYGVPSVKTSPKKILDATTNSICENIEQSVARIIELPAEETKIAMNNLVEDMKQLNYKHFITGLLKYLSSPERKAELFGKVIAPPAPPMTKSEQVLLYVITHLKNVWPAVDTADAVLSNIEYTLFKLNNSPEFNVIESMAHFYAVLCRYFKTKSRLRLFILDAMYCMQFKSLPLIKQCLDVWMHIIPLAHMGIAKSPLVTCLVYLLHFYKCDDRFNRVQDIRNILHRKYFYRVTEWNETKILEMIRNSIKDMKDTPIEKKMLRLAVIIIAKRHGARWCQNHIIKLVLQPLISNARVSNNVKEFCVSLIGPLMKPYPPDMKFQCEIAINQLIDILNKNPSGRMEEAAITSLLCMSRHNQNQINRELLSRKLFEVSPELDDLLRDFVREKPLKIWKKIFARARL